MSRKIYALLVLIGALGFLVLVYLYFFVYYTATVVIQTNIEDYNVEFFSKSTTQNWNYECPQKQCVIPDVSPFEYNIFITKQDYKDEVINTKISPRKRQNFVVELEKETQLNLIESDIAQETVQEKIQRLRDQDTYFASFILHQDTKVHFMQVNDQLEMIFESSQLTRNIMKFPLVRSEDIQVQYIGEQREDVFLQMGESYYIFSLKAGKIYNLPYTLPVSYIKPGNKNSEYLVVTEKGVFLYDISTQDSEFQYLFRDFVYYGESLIGVIYKDEEQKKENFNLTEDGNLIIQYTQDTKERKVLMRTNLTIERIEWQGEKITFTAAGRQYELKNF